MTTSIGELQKLLYVERGHTSNFEEWEKKATHLLARLIFRMTADMEKNHIRWVELLIEMAQSSEGGRDLGSAEAELKYWVDDGLRAATRPVSSCLTGSPSSGKLSSAFDGAFATRA